MENYNLTEYQLLLLKGLIKNMEEVEEIYKDAIKNNWITPQYYIGRMSGYNIFNLSVLKTLVNDINEKANK